MTRDPSDRCSSDMEMNSMSGCSTTRPNPVFPPDSHRSLENVFEPPSTIARPFTAVLTTETKTGKGHLPRACVHANGISVVEHIRARPDLGEAFNEVTVPRGRSAAGTDNLTRKAAPLQQVSNFLYHRGDLT